jgi:hypothetical protein
MKHSAADVVNMLLRLRKQKFMQPVTETLFLFAININEIIRFEFRI